MSLTPASGSSLHRVGYKPVLGSARQQTTPGYRSSTCWTVPFTGKQLISYITQFLTVIIDLKAMTLQIFKNSNIFRACVLAVHQ